jgi:hypothetical protein
MRFKYKELEHEITCLSERLQIVLHDIDSWLDDRGHELVITSVLSDPEKDKELKRVSSSHTEKRAFDFSVKNIPRNVLSELEKEFELKYERWAAISKKTGLPNLIYYHGMGDNYHAHVQVRKYTS